MISLIWFPQEVFRQISEHLDPDDCMRMFLTCKTMYKRKNMLLLCKTFHVPEWNLAPPVDTWKQYAVASTINVSGSFTPSSFRHFKKVKKLNLTKNTYVGDLWMFKGCKNMTFHNCNLHKLGFINSETLKITNSTFEHGDIEGSFKCVELRDNEEESIKLIAKNCINVVVDNCIHFQLEKENQIINIQARYLDLCALEGFANIETVHLSEATFGIDDITTEFKNVTTLTLIKCTIHGSLSGLNKCTKLELLETDIDQDLHIPNARHITLLGCNIGQLIYINALPNLDTVRLCGRSFQNVDATNAFSNARHLYVQDSPYLDAACFPHVTLLHLIYVEIIDNIQEMKNLHTMHVIKKPRQLDFYMPSHVHVFVNQVQIQ